MSLHLNMIHSLVFLAISMEFRVSTQLAEINDKLTPTQINHQHNLYIRFYNPLKRSQKMALIASKSSNQPKSTEEIQWTAV